jgi:hypothetical protein
MPGLKAETWTRCQQHLPAATCKLCERGRRCLGARASGSGRPAAVLQTGTAAPTTGPAARSPHSAGAHTHTHMHTCAPMDPRLDRSPPPLARLEGAIAGRRRRRDKGSVSRYTWPRNLGHARVRRAKSRRDTHRGRPAGG